MAESKLRVATDEEMAEDAIATATEETARTKAVLSVDGREYVLTFTREVVRRMEAQGFDVSHVEAMPVTTIEDLIVGSFEARQPSMSRAARLQVWDSLEDKRDLFDALVQLYMVPVNSLVADPTEATGTWSLA